MAKKKGKSVSFDAMVKFFMQNYGIPTKRDIDRLMARIDRLEIFLEAFLNRQVKDGRLSTKKKSRSGYRNLSAAAMVLETIRKFEDGATFREIAERTGYPDKKLRNIIYRLHKDKMIAYKRRGVYIAAQPQRDKNDRF